jgi:hypothetical protein
MVNSKSIFEIPYYFELRNTMVHYHGVNQHRSSFPKSLGCQIHTLPADSVPIIPWQQDHRHWQLPISARKNAIAPIPSSPPHTRLSNKLLSSIPLFSLSVVLLLPLHEIAALLPTSPLLTQWSENLSRELRSGCRS